MKLYAVFSEGMNVFTDQRKFKTKRTARRNMESFLFHTYGHIAEIVEFDEPSYDELKAENKRLREALEDIANKRTCEKLYPGCEKYKSYEDGWEGVARYAASALTERAREVLNKEKE
ncbi:MAG: hypothetical protein ACK52I_21920 [Pseudomonadota bacterium]